MKITIPEIRHHRDEDPKVAIVCEIMTTFGGGMGGGYRYYYGEILNSDNDKIIIETLEGERVTIYKNFIVIIREVKAYIFKSDKKPDSEAVAVITRTFDELEIDVDNRIDYYNIKNNYNLIQNVIKLYY